MKQNEIDDFIIYLRSCTSNKLYISQEFINWRTGNNLTNELQAIEEYDLYLKRIYKKLDDYISKCERDFIIPEFYIDEYDSDCLIKSKFSFNKDEHNIISLKIQFREQVLQLLRQIDWRDFEKVANLILKENHISGVKITQSKNDQGIDFYGFYKFESDKLLPRFYKYLNFRIIGQVKHSEKNKGVDHQKVASFGTEINKLRRANDTSYFQSLDRNFINSDLPIIGIFITNSYYPQKTIDFAKEYGIIYWNGKQVAEDLCSNEFISSIFNNTTKQLDAILLKEKIQKL